MTETTKRTTKVWAHRGASGYRPENTLEAFELAIRQGADGIELDVHTSADGELIVMHDETVDRVTDGTGLIKDMTSAQLKELKVSTSAEPTGIYRVPTLAEVLDLMRTTDMMVNIELKNSICFYPGMEEKILKLVNPAVYHLKYPQFMEEVKRAGLKMHVWTANKPEHIQLVKDAGAEAVITNYPDRAIEIIEK